jgi:hypothetical protein
VLQGILELLVLRTLGPKVGPARWLGFRDFKGC